MHSSHKDMSVMEAVMSGNPSKLRASLAAGGDVDGRGPDGGTPLVQAAIQGMADIARYLLAQGANVDAQNQDGWSALHFAAQEYHLDVARLLLERGAQVDIPDVHGNTPLWRAVFSSQGRGGMIELLLRAGADKDRANKSGVSPRQLAVSIANYDVAKFVQ
jgi:uncharacterized protein